MIRVIQRTVVREAIVAALILLLATSGWAAGVRLHEMGTPDMGTASAGRAAMAQDAATAFGNPAGMTRLERPDLLVGTQLLVIDSEFESGPATTTACGPGDINGVPPGGNLFYVHPLGFALAVLARGYP